MFVHGCFWHRHPGCKRTTTPKTRTNFWNEKFRKNVERDALAVRQTKDAGWDSLIVWECETFDRERLRKKLKNFLEKRT
jgi:DNA mismatch endonuclease, patch repair protein